MGIAHVNLNELVNPTRKIIYFTINVEILAC